MDCQTAKHVFRHNRTRQSAAIVCLTATGALMGAVSLAPARPQLLWNFTASVPLGLYRISATPPQPGDLLVIDARGSAGSALLKSGALAKGRLLLKPLAARAGDTVCRENLAVTVNGQLAALARPHTSDDRALPVWSGCRHLASNQIFLLSSHPDSFDSRYFGPVSGRDVVGVAHPLMTYRTSPVEVE